MIAVEFVAIVMTVLVEVVVVAAVDIVVVVVASCCCLAPDLAVGSIAVHTGDCGLRCD